MHRNVNATLHLCLNDKDHPTESGRYAVLYHNTCHFVVSDVVVDENGAHWNCFPGHFDNEIGRDKVLVWIEAPWMPTQSMVGYYDYGKWLSLKQEMEALFKQ